MEPNFQTSFIPKKPIIEKRTAPVRSVNIFTIIAIFVLFAVLLATGALFFYKTTLTKSIADMKSQLDAAQKRFEPAKITELQVLDNRLKASTQVLANHVNILPIFSALGAITMKSVRYSNFSYGLGEPPNVNATISVSGVAAGYRSIALQSDLFADKNTAKDFIDPVFSNLSLDEKGNVSFNLQFSISPTLINYKQTLAAQTAQPGI